MSIKRNVLLAAILAAFSGAFVAQAAEEKPAEATPAETTPTAKAEPAKKKVKPHSHAQEKSGTPAAESADAEKPKKKPLHDHGKMHKGQ